MEQSSDAGGESFTSVNIEEDPHLPLVTFIREQIHALPPTSSDCCIFKVPPVLREVNEKAYTPKIVSIGPFHHGKSKLQDTEEYKLRHTKAFLRRPNRSLEDCVRVVKEIEKETINCYEGSSTFRSDEFVKIILVDSCFILEFILRDADGVTDRPDLYTDVKGDMILLENQLPFFLLDRLFRCGIWNEQEQATGTQLLPELFIKNFIHVMLIQDVPTMTKKVKDYLTLNPENKVKHFVDLLRICHLPSTPRSSPENTGLPQTIPNAMWLQEAGIKFKSIPGNSILNIKFTDGELKFPKISIDDNSECVLRNMVALENCLYQNDSYIIDYIFFMDSLIDTAKDADLLIENGIVDKWLGNSSATAALFNNLGKENALYGSNYYFRGISVQLNDYCNVRCHKWMAIFKRDYCNTPWMIASSIAAVILLFLTLLQTICTLISLFISLPLSLA